MVPIKREDLLSALDCVSPQPMSINSGTVKLTNPATGRWASLNIVH